MSGLDFLNSDGINFTPVSAANPLPVTATISGTATVGVEGADGATQASLANAFPTSSASRLIAALGTTLTRPANATPYTALDSISDNATAGSVTAQPVTASDLADALVMLTEIKLETNDTGLAAGTSIRVYIFNADPTANSGVGAGDNVAYTQKRNRFVGSMSGSFRAFSDGGMARLTPDEGTYIICAPSSGGTTLWLQYQALAGFTPSANSTTIIPMVKGFQGRA